MNSIEINFRVSLVVINSYTRRRKTRILIPNARSDLGRLSKFSAIQGIHKVPVLVTRTGIILRAPPPFFLTGKQFMA